VVNAKYFLEKVDWKKGATRLAMDGRGYIVLCRLWGYGKVGEPKY
jgi:hypothetical protein